MKRIKTLLQPKGTNLCGQYCVAMLAGITPEEAIEAIGKRGRTTTRDLIRGLQKLGYGSGPAAVRIPKGAPMPGFGIVSLQHTIETAWGNKRVRRHWVLIYNGCSYDPAGHPWGHYLDNGWRLTSYLPIGFEPKDDPRACRLVTIDGHEQVAVVRGRPEVLRIPSAGPRHICVMTEKPLEPPVFKIRTFILRRVEAGELIYEEQKPSKEARANAKAKNKTK